MKKPVSDETIQEWWLQLQMAVDSRDLKGVVKYAMCLYRAEKDKVIKA